MGREVRRVPLDFAWPMKKTWKGFINPYNKHSHQCPHCNGSGLSPKAKFLQDTFYHHVAEEKFGRFLGYSIASIPSREIMRARGWDNALIENLEMARSVGFKIIASWRDKLDESDIKALVKAGRLMDFTHTWTKETGWKKNPKAKLPTNDEVAAWDSVGLGHDSINSWILVKHRCRKLKIKTECEHCEGHGNYWDDPKYKKLSDEWKDEEPPKGDGWQMWETTSEGSPISPVFDSPEKLAEWLATMGASSFGSMTCTYDEWLSMIKAGWAPSAVGGPGGLESGVAAVHSQQKEDADAKD